MASPPRFFLQGHPEPGPPRLAEGEAVHATRVLRLRPGDPCVGLDGRGHAWPMRVAAVGRRDLGLELTGAPEHEPEPGTPGAPLPWIEVAVAWPRRPRAEEMLRRLTQLGVARITPLVARRSGPQSGPRSDAGDGKRGGEGSSTPPEPGEARWLKLLQDACKQSRRAWLPDLGEARSPLELLLARPGAAVALLDPERGMSLDTWARSLAPDAGCGTREHPIVLAVGPEGGFDAEERDAFHRKGATSVRLAPHVLRIETAAEAAMAVAATVWMR
ncbi:MAG: 16S rRNA (uracil(1498)-N(3))-methyltransferase [Planctomycetota bacterium]